MMPRILALTLVLMIPLLMGNTGQIAAAPAVPSWPPNGWTVDVLTPTLRFSSDGHTQLILMPKGSSVPIVETVIPKGNDSLAIATPLQEGSTYRWRVRSNPYPPGQNVYTWSAWSPEWAFHTPGGAPPPASAPSAPSTPPAPSAPAPSLPGAPLPPAAPEVPALWAASAQVRLVAPSNGSIAAAIAPVLSWIPPAGATHFEMVITPVGNEAGTVRFVNKIDSSYPIPGPPAWYGMLPDTQYQWKVRVNNAPGPVPADHASWGPWSETFSFRTPIPPSEIILAVSPSPGTRVANATPTLTWKNPSEDVFYYEVQVSRDPSFTTDPSRAVAPVYWEVRHGGLTTPLNSYTVSSRYALERGKVYYWRVRPAVPFAIRPVAWSPAWSFVVP